MAARRHNQALSTAQAHRFASIMGLLRSGQADDAARLARLLAEEAPDSADAHQLHAMCSADAGDGQAAEAAFRRALALAPDAPVVRLNFASWLGLQGRPREGFELLLHLPVSAQVALRMGLLARQAGDHAQARAAFERLTRLDRRSVDGWQGLGNALVSLGEYGLAVEAFRTAVGLSEDKPMGWLNLGVALRLLGKPADALACLRRAASLDDKLPELEDTVNGVLQDLGRTADAIEGARRVVARYPAFAPGHETFAQLLWESGEHFAPEDDPLAAFQAAAQAQPGNLHLQRRFLRTLLAMRRAERAWQWLDRLGWASMGDPAIEWLAADALDALGRLEEATRVYERVHGRFAADSPQFLNARARHAFRRELFDLAERCAAGAIELDPHNQEAWAHLGTAWRLAGDAREDWLFDYGRLVGYVEVEPPAGYPDMATWLAALATALDRMHLAGRDPINQSVRNGSQTAGRLFSRDDPVILDAAAALGNAVSRWLRTLPAPAGARPHPFLSRAGQGARFVGSWSVRLRSSGRHANHIHNEGWMSSAFHVSLPACMRDAAAGSHEGWLQFGQPMEELGLAVTPRRMIGPIAGHLALFPSYTWHGTVPFEDEEPRLTIAFDMQPA